MLAPCQLPRGSDDGARRDGAALEQGDDPVADDVPLIRAVHLLDVVPQVKVYRIT